MNPGQTLRIRQTQKQLFSPAFDQYLTYLTKSKREILAELRKLTFGHPYLHTITDDLLSACSQTENQKSHLYFQLHTANLPYNEQAAAFIIESLDSHGFFHKEEEKPYPCPEEEILSTLALIQRFEPYGVATDNSIDFIKKQLADQGQRLALQILDGGADDLMRQDHTALCKRFSITSSELEKQMNIIRSCRLYPCQTDDLPDSYMEADVRIETQEGELILIPLDPSFEINKHIESTDPQVQQYLGQLHLTLDLLNKRNLTLIIVFQALAKIQNDFLLKKQKALAPCSLQNIANLTGLPVSTISRACANKYYEMEGSLHAFHELLCRSNHGKSHDEIHQAICEIIQQEKSSYPYDDEQISIRLRSYDIHLSRRRVSQYRKKWNIPNSYQRKNKQNC